jgi:5,5'-dehydrodivanillate O-demethylase
VGVRLRLQANSGGWLGGRPELDAASSALHAEHLRGGRHALRVPDANRRHTHTLSVVWAWEPVPIEQQPYEQTSIPHWYAPITDPATGRWITTHTINQDTAAWVGQGAVTDRENEHLGRSDIGIVMLRNRLADDLARVERGEDPSGLIRDPERNVCITWPNNRTERLTKAPTKAEKLTELARFNNGLRGENDYFRFYAGQPADIAKAYEEAMGL